MPTVVRCLWGGPVEHGTWDRVWRKDVRCWFFHPSPIVQYCYVYGQDNADRLMRECPANVRVELVDPDPWPDGKHDVDKDGHIVRPWHYKLWLMKRAITDHGPIIYCDLDTVCMAQSQQQIEDELPKRDLSLSLYVYKRPRHMRRKERRHRMLCISGNWMHVADPKFLDKVLAKMAVSEGLAAWHDEVAMGELFDDQFGDFCGETYWLENYESPIMMQPYHRCPWAPMSDDGYWVEKVVPVPFRWHRLFTQWSRRDVVAPEFVR